MYPLKCNLHQPANPCHHVKVVGRSHRWSCVFQLLAEALFTFVKEHGRAVIYSCFPRPPPPALTVLVRELWVEDGSIRDVSFTARATVPDGFCGTAQQEAAV